MAGSVIAGITPTLASCGRSSWVDGTKPVDTTDFAKCDEETFELLENSDYKTEFIENATNAYLAATADNPKLAEDDFAYSLNQLCSVIHLIPDWLQIQWGNILEGLLDGLLPEDIAEIIIPIIKQYAYSPLKTVEINSFKGKLKNFKVDENSIDDEIFKASYNLNYDLDVKFNLGLDYIPEDILDIIEYLLGVSLRSFEIEIKAKTATEVHKTPVAVYGDMAIQCKTQMLQIIKNGELPKNKYYTGLGILPYLAQNEEMLSQDKTWYLEVLPDIEIIFTNNVGSISLLTVLPKKYRIDYTRYGGLDTTSNPAPSPIVFPSNITVFVLQSLFGWSTYYFSDIVYENQLPPVMHNGGNLWN